MTPTRLTLTVGSLVSLLARCVTMPKAYSDYTNYYHRLTAYSDYTNYYHHPMAYSDYTNYYHRQGLEPGDISQKLKQEGIKATGRGITKFLGKFIESGSRLQGGSGRPSKATAAVRT